MTTPRQYRDTAAAFGELVENSAGSTEKQEFQQRQQSFTTLADNEQWLVDHQHSTVHASEQDRIASAVVADVGPVSQTARPDLPRDPLPGAVTASDEEHILRCLGAALIMEWSALPTKLQKQLFDKAGAMGPLLETAPLRGQIARFLHTHKNAQGTA